MRAILLAIAVSVLALGGTAYADEPDPPNRTGCCFSFDDSPVNVVFCSVPDACKFEGPPK